MTTLPSFNVEQHGETVGNLYIFGSMFRDFPNNFPTLPLQKKENIGNPYLFGWIDSRQGSMAVSPLLGCLKGRRSYNFPFLKGFLKETLENCKSGKWEQ